MTNNALRGITDESGRALSPGLLYPGSITNPTTGTTPSVTPTAPVDRTPVVPPVTYPTLTPTTDATTGSSTTLNAPPIGGLSDAYQPRQVQANETVQGQLTGLLSRSNPLLQQAEASAQRQANKRGLLNSTLAAGAGRAAHYTAALPIAQQDSETYARAAEKEQDLRSTLVRDQAGFAQERALSVWDKENLAYAQYIKGVADINTADIELKDKQAGVDRLWTEYQAGRPLSTSLSRVSVIDGRIVDLAATNS